MKTLISYLILIIKIILLTIFYIILKNQIIELNKEELLISANTLSNYVTTASSDIPYLKIAIFVILTSTTAYLLESLILYIKLNYKVSFLKIVNCFKNSNIVLIIGLILAIITSYISLTITIIMLIITYIIKIITMIKKLNLKEKDIIKYIPIEIPNIILIIILIKFAP